MDPVNASGTAVIVPPPIVPPRGLSGLFDDYDPSSILDTSSFPANQVFLNVYDTEAFRNINLVSTANNNMLLGGIFHASVEIYAKEWCYESSSSSSADPACTGISQRPPRSHPQHTYRTTVPLGCTELSEEEVVKLLTERLPPNWLASDYDPIHHNSLNFSNALCMELGLSRGIPGWVDRASRTVSFIDSTSRTAAEQVEQTVRTVLAEAQPGRLTEVAQAQAQELAEAAQAAQAQAAQVAQQHAQVLGEAANAAQAQVQVLGEVVQAQAQVIGEKAQVLSQELLGDDIVEKAQELTEKTQEHARSLWQRAQAAALKLREDALTTSGPKEGRRQHAEEQLMTSAWGLSAPGSFWDPRASLSASLGGSIFASRTWESSTSVAPKGGEEEAMKCPAGHILQTWVAKAGTCDGCARKVHNGETVMDCRTCDWYLCDQCCAALKGPATRKASSPTTGPAAAAAAATTVVVPAERVTTAASTSIVSLGPNSTVVDLTVGDDELPPKDAAAEEEQE